MELRDWAAVVIGIGSIFSTVVCIYVARSLGRRDRLEDDLAEAREEINHMQGFLSYSGYRAPSK